MELARFRGIDTALLDEFVCAVCHNVATEPVTPFGAHLALIHVPNGRCSCLVNTCTAFFAFVEQPAKNRDVHCVEVPSRPITSPCAALFAIFSHGVFWNSFCSCILLPPIFQPVGDLRIRGAWVQRCVPSVSGADAFLVQVSPSCAECGAPHHLCISQNSVQILSTHSTPLPGAYLHRSHARD